MENVHRRHYPAICLEKEAGVDPAISLLAWAGRIEMGKCLQP